MTRQQQQHKNCSPSIWEEDYDEDYFDQYDDYGDYSVNQRNGGGGGGNSKTEKRQAKRGGGCANVYSSRHIRTTEAQRIQRK